MEVSTSIGLALSRNADGADPFYAVVSRIGLPDGSRTR